MSAQRYAQRYDGDEDLKEMPSWMTSGRLSKVRSSRPMYDDGLSQRTPNDAKKYKKELKQAYEKIGEAREELRRQVEIGLHIFATKLQMAKKQASENNKARQMFSNPVIAQKISQTFIQELAEAKKSYKEVSGQIKAEYARKLQEFDAQEANLNALMHRFDAGAWQMHFGAPK